MLKTICLVVAMMVLLSCKITTYFITRHAEKVSTAATNDPPLTADGEKQSQDLETF